MEKGFLRREPGAREAAGHKGTWQLDVAGAKAAAAGAAGI